MSLKVYEKRGRRSGSLHSDLGAERLFDLDILVHSVGLEFPLVAVTPIPVRDLDLLRRGCRARRPRGMQPSCPETATDFEVHVAGHQLRLRVPLLLRLLRELLELFLLRELGGLLAEALFRDLLELDLLERVLPRLLPRFVRRAGAEPLDS